MIYNFCKFLLQNKVNKRNVLRKFIKFYFDSNDSKLNDVRNIGIIAHVDAGKTTTTERMLFHSGWINTFGDVDKGNTITDFMPQERERGFTISSTPITMQWNKHKINLIDTPGHIDFTFEVEKCLSILDGCVVILDACEGVEPQTYLVWKQANHFKIPKIIYLNKMDRPRSDYKMCLNSILSLDSKPVLLQLPIFKENKFSGLIDILSLERYTWNLDDNLNGINFTKECLKKNDSQYEEAVSLKEDLIGLLSQYNDITNDILENDLFNFSKTKLINILRKSTIKNEVVPVILGSSFKNIGLELLLDAINDYLPSPLEKNFEISNLLKNVYSGLIFKIVHHKSLGTLYFIKIYSGHFVSGLKIFNSNKNVIEKILKLYNVYANEYIEIKSASYGDIIAISGLNSSTIGDFLIKNSDEMYKLKNNFKDNCSLIENIILNGLQIPDPVYFCSIEAPSLKEQHTLNLALERLQKEDPSFSVIFNKDTNQSILRGMGDLHLEIIKDRLKREYNLDPFYGNLQVFYNESIEKICEDELILQKQFKSINNYVKIKLVFKPDKLFKRKNILKVVETSDNNLNKIRSDRLKQIETGILNALEQGPLLNFPLTDLYAELHEFNTTNATLGSMVIKAANECTLNAIRKGNPYLLEPIMNLEIDVLNEYQGVVFHELSKRRAILINKIYVKNNLLLNFDIPLAETFNLSSVLRTITSGRIFIKLNLKEYQQVNQVHQNLIIEKLKFAFKIN